MHMQWHQHIVKGGPEAWKRMSGPPGPVDSRFRKAPTVLAALHNAGMGLLAICCSEIVIWYQAAV